jgi:peptide/nickel transport system permease protein
LGLIDYAARRCIQAVPTAIGITVVIFLCIQLAPGGPLDYFLAAHPDLTYQDPDLIERLKVTYGLDQPIYVQYFKWVGRVLVGDFGISFSQGSNIIDEIASRIGDTLLLYAFSHLIGWPIAIFLGVVSAVKRYSWTDNIAMILALFGISMPAFWMGLMMIFGFSLRLDWFPTGGTTTLGIVFASIGAYVMNRIWHLILPSINIATHSTATIARLTRSSMLDVLRMDYVVTARAKGVKELVVIYKHALRNALLPVVTVIGLSLGFMISGAVITETIFAWPGIGRLMISAVHQRDYPLVMGVATITALMVLLTNIATDIAYSFLDPRIRY